MKFCPECGSSIGQPPGRFCSECGASLHAPLSTSPPSASEDRNALIAMVGAGFDLLEAGNAAAAEATFATAGDKGWPGGWLGLSHLYESQSRFEPAAHFAERAFSEADALPSEADRLSIKAGAALGAARCLVQVGSEGARQALSGLSAGSDMDEAYLAYGRRVPKYLDFLLTTDGIDAETAVLGAEFGTRFFTMFGSDGTPGANYGRMLVCLGFVGQWGDAEQQVNALGTIRHFVHQWGSSLPISVASSPDAMRLLDDLRADGLI